MNGFNPKSLHNFSKSMASSLNKETLINAEVIKRVASPLLFGMSHHAAIDKMKGEAKTANGVFHQCEDQAQVILMVERLSEDLKNINNYKKLASLTALTLNLELKEVVCSNLVLHNEKMEEILGMLLEATSEMMDGDFRNHSITIDCDDCYNSSGYIKYNKSIVINCKGTEISFNADISYDEYDGYQDNSYNNFLIDLNDIEDEIDCDDDTYNVIEKINQILSSILLNSFEEVSNPSLSVSRDLMLMITEEAKTK